MDSEQVRRFLKREQAGQGLKSGSAAAQLKRRNSSEPFVPPKPKEFDNA